MFMILSFCSLIQSHAFLLNSRLLATPKRRHQVTEILKEVETYIWRISVRSGDIHRVQLYLRTERGHLRRSMRKCELHPIFHIE